MIDLRSDTVTRPTPEMLDAMRAATLEDDARDGDATVRRLEALAAGRIGKEASLFLPSGTMANLAAVLAHTERGGRVLLDESAHILRSELGGVAALAGAVCTPVSASRGVMDVPRLADALSATGPAGAPLICMETSHNAAGGSVLPLEYMRSVYELAQARGARVHIDGARIFNAAIALRVEPAAIARDGDSVAFCVSKGLSAPVGSLLCGSSAFVERARFFRRMLGGGMRQCGPLAAAAIVALDTMAGRLGEDHRTAQRLARALCAIDERLVTPADVSTNIVRVELPPTGPDATQYSAALAQRDVRVSACARHALRFVTHRHIGDAEIDRAADAFRTVWNETNAR